MQCLHLDYGDISKLFGCSNHQGWAIVVDIISIIVLQMSARCLTSWDRATVGVISGWEDLRDRWRWKWSGHGLVEGLWLEMLNPTNLLGWGLVLKLRWPFFIYPDIRYPRSSFSAFTKKKLYLRQERTALKLRKPLINYRTQIEIMP